MTESAPGQAPAEGRRQGRRGKGPRRQVDGLLLLDKPVGLTSNQALQRVKRLYQAAKAGHTGSLDPLASGMLPICLGQATKVSAFLLEAVKEYRVAVRFGVQTATGDAEGETVAESPLTRIEPGILDEALRAFRGPIRQVPPMYSALKHEGRRLYELARAGREVARQPRSVHIETLEVEDYEAEQPVLRVRCSKGTYIRTLAEDIARACGTVGHVAALRRTAVEPFDGMPLHTLGDLEAVAEDGPAALDALLQPADAALAGWPALELGAQQAYYLLQGNAVSGGAGHPPGRVRLYGRGRGFLGIGEVLGDGRVAPKRLFRPATGVADRAS